ncbi:MAG TPA: hypothetical protein VF474_15635 [Phenylobacterium sp.]
MVVRHRGAHGDIVQRQGEARLRGVVERALEHAHGHLWALRQFGGERQGRRKQGVRLDHLVQEAEIQRLLGADDALAQHEVQRPRQAELLHQEEVAALVGQEREAQGGAAQPRLCRTDPEVAG